MTHLFIALVLAFSSAPPPDLAEGNLPVSREARIKESVSPNEFSVYAVGIAGGPKKYRETAALIDARKAAVYYLLYSGSDPILNGESEKMRFKPLEQGFFEVQNIAKYIVNESPDFSQRVAIDKKTRLKVEKIFTVNTGRLKEDLVTLAVLEATRSIAADIGYPNIMVMPEVAAGQDPVAKMNNDPVASQGAAVIESYLTAKDYDVILPQQSSVLSGLTDQTALLTGIADDPQYRLALTIGSDVYLTYRIDVAPRVLGSTTVRKASATVRAFETSTARLLGTETGYSQERTDPDQVVVEEALKDAVDKVLARIDSYWKDDRTRGVQYRVIVKVAGEFDRDATGRFTMLISDYLMNNCANSKENILSAKTLDFLVWAKLDQYDRSRKLADAMVKSFNGLFKGGELSQVNVNRKMILLELKKL